MGRMPTSGAGTPRKSSSGAIGYPASLAMAVPKQKQSHARTHKRRSQHKVSAPTYNACPQCHSPRRPHRVCPVCGTLRRARGRDAARRRTTTTTTTSPRVATTVAVDANGADLGPAEVAAGALRSPPRQGVTRPALRPGRRDRPEVGRDGVEVVDAPVSIAKAADPVRAARRDARTPRSSGRPRPSAPARPTRSSAAAPPAPRSPPALFNIKRAPRDLPARARRCPCPSPSTRSRCSTSGANAEVPPRAPRPVRLHGRGASPAACSASSARASGCSPTARRRRRARRWSSRPTRCWPSASRRPGALRLRRQRRGHAGRRRRRRRRRHRRLHRQHRRSSSWRASRRR